MTSFSGIFCNPLLAQFSHDQATDNSAAKVLIDYKQDDYRSFCMCIHDIHGLVILYCTRKKAKGPHFQLPGGHVDEPEFLESAKKSSNELGQLYLAARAGLARELFEETGIDVRSQLDRIQPAILRSTVDSYKNSRAKLPNEFKHRLFFALKLADNDFFEGDSSDLIGPMECDGPERKLKLKLSHEHQGFRFETDPNKARDLLESHSGGKVSHALTLALNLNTTE